MLTVTLVGAISFARELSLGSSLVTRPTRGRAGLHCGSDSRAEPTRCTAGEEQWEAGGGARSPGARVQRPFGSDFQMKETSNGSHVHAKPGAQSHALCPQTTPLDGCQRLHLVWGD